MDTKKKIIIGLLAVIVVVGGYFIAKKKAPVKKININGPTQTQGPLNQGPVSPISGLPCENWNKRAVAVMQPADVSARPAAGFSDADIVFEMPVFTASNTRLMGVYVCNLPNEVGSIRSARHDYLPLAKSLNAVYVHWGYSKFAQTLLEQKILDNIDCLTSSFCGRWPQTGIMKYEDTGFISKENIEAAIKKYGYSTTDMFSGYPHQDEAPIDQRPNGGRLRVVFPKPYDVAYNYDKVTNSYLREWSGVNDTDKNNGKRVAPKNVVVMIAKSEQIKLATDYKARGVQNPWDLVPEEDRAGLNDIPGAPGIGRYNNIELGDPWFDTIDSGDAYFYMNGQQTKGTWKKDKARLDSKLTFYDSSGSEIKFVPGQIWVDVLEPDEIMQWIPVQ